MNNNRAIDQFSRNELCTGCGTCAGMCPQNAINIVIDEKKGIHLPRIDSEKCNKCGICYKVCPGDGVDIDSLNRKLR